MLVTAPAGPAGAYYHSPSFRYRTLFPRVPSRLSLLSSHQPSMYTLCHALLPCVVAALSMPCLVSAARSSTPPAPPQRRATNYGYYIPMDGGGSMLTVRTALHHPYHDIIFDSLRCRSKCKVHSLQDLANPSISSYLPILIHQFFRVL